MTVNTHSPAANTLAEFDIVIPLFRIRWNTRAVLEGLTHHYQPRSIHIITPTSEVTTLRSMAADWAIAPLQVHAEETFFGTDSLSKEAICAELELGKSLYNPGWFYQQLLKLGAFEGIENLSEWYVVWDSDLLPVATWQLLREGDSGIERPFALIQHNAYGNSAIVSKWDKWINMVLGVEPLTAPVGTFVPHHMWFKQEHLKSFAHQLNRYFETDTHWLKLMMRSANEFGTFSEFWSYVSWVAERAPQDLAFYPYEKYGDTTERFFDDGTGLFSAALIRYLANSPVAAVRECDRFSPSYAEVDGFIRDEYGLDALPSSLSFESSPRHLKKNEDTMHIEERRSRWNPRNAESRDVSDPELMTA